MTTLAANLPISIAALVLAPAVAAGVAALSIRPAVPAATMWRRARWTSVVMVAAALLAAGVRLATRDQANAIVRLDAVTVAMLALVGIIGWVVIRYSTAYVAGDPHEHRYAGRLLATLAAVSLVVVANHLIVLMLAWTATSIALHGLLTFFRDRPVAVAVAHKKFLLARAADLCMVGAAVGFWAAFDTLRIDGIASAATEGSLPVGARVGVVLLAVAAMLKSALLPFHGWLIQVMEAPTPVSALLHAGVVNLGGFVLLRFAPVVDGVVEARVLLVVVGVLTAIVAAMVMTTRISVKVSLAWSTCAQMGFMLMQCGLGLWEMALLHLLAHSVYKAHAFLGAGGTVRRTQRRQLAPRAATPTLRSVALGVAVAALGTVAAGLGWGLLPFASPLSATLWVMLGIVGLALVPLTVPRRGRDHVALAGRAVAIPLLYLVLHEAAAALAPSGAPAPAALLVFTGAAFLVLFAVQTACRVAPDGHMVRRIRPWIYGGLFLDDAFTRVAFAVSPPKAAETLPTALPHPEVLAVVPAPARVPVSR